MSGGDDSHVLALVEHICLTDLKRLIRHEISHFRPSEAKVHRTVILGGGDGGVLGLGPVAGIDDHHVGKDAHKCDVLHCLMGRPVFAQGDTGV